MLRKLLIGASLVMLIVALLTASCVTTPLPEEPTPTPAEPIVIGVPTSLGYPHGAEGLEAVKMATEEINAKGGVSVAGVKHLFRVESIDDRSAAPGTAVSDALMAYEKLILEKKPNVLIVGTYRSEVALAALDLLSEYKTIELNTIHMSPAVWQKVGEDYESYKYFFRACHDAIQMATSIAAQFDVLKEKYGLSKCYVINEDAAWAHATAGATIGMIEAQGWEVVGHDVTPLGATDYSAPLLGVTSTGAQAVCAIFSLPETAVMAKQMYDMKVPAILAGYHSYIVPGHMWETLGGKVTYAVVTAGELGLVPSEKYPKSVEFFDKFKRRLGHWPDADHSGATAYDAVYIYAAAVERAGSLDPEKVIPALEATDYMGVNGRMRFSPEHQMIFGDDPNETACEVTFQWIDGARVPVLPKSIAEGEIQLPPWME